MAMKRMVAKRKQRDCKEMAKRGPRDRTELAKWWQKGGKEVT